MSSPDVPSSRESSYWLVFLVRALVAIIVALAITFSADHSTTIGYIAFGGYALVSGLVLGVLSRVRLPKSTERAFFVAQGLVGVVFGAIALATMGAGVAFLLLLVGAWAALSGVLELYSGVRARGSFAQARDWIFVGALSVVFAVGVFLIPASFEDRFTGPDGVARVLTASVVLVGLLGAYAAILGVYLVISALSLKWGTQRAPQVAEGGN